MNKRGLSLFENSAVKSLERFMKHKGMKIEPRTIAILEGREGPLATSVVPDFVQTGKEIGETLMA
jgi:hypothetical protein